jgi:hypothetical protein
MMMLIAWLPWLLLGGGALFLGLRAVRAFEQRGAANAELAALRERVQVLENTVTEQGESLRRVTDGQEFTQRLLLERTVRDSNAERSAPAL